MMEVLNAAFQAGADLSVEFGSYLRRVFTPRVPSRSIGSSDIIAGLTVAAVIIPNAMAYALLVGLPPQMGLYATLAGSAVGILWGSSAFVVTGAVGIVSLLTLTALIPFAPFGSPTFITLAITLAVIVGMIQFLVGLFRLGYLARLIPHSVLIGFTSAAAIIIAATQIPALLGFSVVQKEHVIDTLFQIVMKLPHVHLLTASLGITTLLFLICMRHIAPRFPAALCVLGISIIASLYIHLGELGVALIGSIPSHLPIFDIPDLTFTTITTLISSAAVIALVGFMETYAIAKSLTSTANERPDADRELTGQGLANVASGLAGGFPVSGSFSASAVNVHSGAQSASSVLVTSITILGALLFLTPYLALLPKVVLSAIVISAVIPMVNLQKMRTAFSLSLSGGSTAAITFILAFLFKPDVAVIAGVFIALMILIHDIMFARVSEVGFDRALSNTLHRVGRDSVETLPKLLMVRVDQAILYANSERVMDEIRAIIANYREREAGPRMFVMSFAGVNDVDLSGLEDLGELFSELRADNVDIGVIYAKKRERDTLRRAYEVVGPITLLHSIDELKARYELVMRAGKVRVS